MKGTSSKGMHVQEKIGWTDPEGKGGGAESEKLDEADAQRQARELEWGNQAATDNKNKPNPSRVGGPYAGA